MQHHAAPVPVKFLFAPCGCLVFVFAGNATAPEKIMRNPQRLGRHRLLQVVILCVLLYGGSLPKRNTFDLFASATSARTRNPIDSRGSFLIRRINADQARGCVWLTIQDQVKPGDRTGLWRCEPLQNKYQKILDLAADVSLTETGILVHRNADERLAWVDHTSLQVTALPEFAHASGPRVYPRPYFVSPYTNSYQLEFPTPQPHLIKVGDHLIGSNGKLFTRDGKEYPLENVTHWRLLQRFGKGFITHYETVQDAVVRRTKVRSSLAWLLLRVARVATVVAKAVLTHSSCQAGNRHVVTRRQCFAASQTGMSDEISVRQLLSKECHASICCTELGSDDLLGFLASRANRASA